MSDPKRATLITVGVPKSAKNNVNKTVRLTINLVESNESKYPELNYKELVIAEEKKKRVQNGKTSGLDPFSDNDDDVERVARKFEQKYGGKSTYGRKGRSKQDDFADIGAGYDENDSFIDNTHGYDEMIPPECDTLYGGFYINSGSLEFKTVPQDQSGHSDEASNRRNKRRISSSSSEESSESSSESESQEEKDPKTVPNGTLHSHNTETRKKKNKKSDKNKANKVRRTDSSAANSGKQTSDDNGHVDGESVDSRTSQSDSLTSKPAPSSENAITSDSSRDVESKTEVKLPPSISEILQSLEGSVERYMSAHPGSHAKILVQHTEIYLSRLEDTLKQNNADSTQSKAAWVRASRALGMSRTKLMQRVKAVHDKTEHAPKDKTEPPEPPPSIPATNNKRKHNQQDNIDYEHLTDEQREAKIVETLARLRDLIEERKPGMLSSYNAECLRVQEERKKLQLAAQAEGSAAAERRLPKRRFPWCTASRALLGQLAKLARTPAAAANLLATRALPLFPTGFVRMPTLLRQADLSKEVKASDVKRQRLGSASHYTQNQGLPTNPALPITFQEPIQFPSSLTVTTTLKSSPEKAEPEEKYNSNTKSLFGSLVKSFSLEKDEKREDLYVPPNNIGSITITPVPQNQKDKKSISVTEKQPGLIRVKSPAALNEMVTKKDVKVVKKPEKLKEKRVESPLHIDTSFQPSKKDPSPKESRDAKKIPSPKDGVTQKQIESMKVAENNIPRPALIPVHHSPTFAKPDKRPPEGKRKEDKKKKDVIIVSEVDPLSNEPLNIDDSSSDVEVIETDKSDSVVPSKDKNSVTTVPKVKGKDEVSDDIDTVMRNIREMEMAHSQEPTKFSNAFSSVITSAKHELGSNRGNHRRNAIYGSRNDEDKFTERPSLNKMDGSNVITG